MTQQFSFTSFLAGNTQTRYQQSQGNNARVSLPTPKQITYYNDLCARKNIRPKDTNQFTFETLGKEIEELRTLPDSASLKQIVKIEQLVEEITKLGGKIAPFSQEFMRRLTGGREGTASQLIETLIERRNTLNEVAPPSEAQLAIMVEWFLCPDIPFEDYGVEKKVYLDHLTSYSTDVDTSDKLEKRLWRLTTAEEFAQRISKHITKKQASAFIDQYRSVFYDWRKTRITAQQANYIRELEKRLTNIYVPKAVEFAIDNDGNVQEIKTGSSHDARGDLQTVAYAPIEDLQLAQMSYQDASVMIDQLKSELSNKETYRFGDIYDDTQQSFQDKTASYNERTHMGSASDIQNARVKEYTAINDLVYKLEAVAGFENQDLHDLLCETILEGEDARSEETRNEIKLFMESTIDFKRGNEQVKKDIGRLYLMSEDSLIATDIVEQIAGEILANLE